MRCTVARKLSVFTAGIIIFGCQFLNAQQGNNAQVPAATIRVSTHLVLVDVVVTTKQGQPVPGLQQSDFTVHESGKAQKISVFVTPEQNKTGAPAGTLPPGIYSNRPQYRSAGGPLTVLILDAANTQFKDQAYARLQMLKFARERFQPGQRMAVLTLTDSLHVLQDFTTDPQLLYDALDRFLPRERLFDSAANVAPAPTSSNSAQTRGGGLQAIQASIQNAILDFSQAGIEYDLERRTEITFQALDVLARALGGLPGHKNVIWVTGDLPFTLKPEDRTMTAAELEENLPSMYTRRAGQHSSGNYASTARALFAEQIRDADARLTAAQIALYPVDARGLTTDTNQDSQEVMRAMARDTGGRAYVNQNEIKTGVERAVEDASATYTLGYYPENKKLDGNYRGIKVTVNHAGAELQYRHGYFALVPMQAKTYKAGSEVAAAIAAALPSTQVTFDARVRPASNGKVSVDFLVDTSSISTEDVANGKKMKVSFYVATFSRQGKILGSNSETVERVFDSSSYAQMMQHGTQLHMDIAPPAEATGLRLAVLDGRTGLVGTIDAPLNSP